MSTRCWLIWPDGVAMGYKRTISPLTGDIVSVPARLAGLGMALGVEPEAEANIEDALLAAVREGMEAGDLRLLGLVTAWLERYRPWVNADRIIRCLRAEPSPRIQAFWCSRAQDWARDQRWKRLRTTPVDPVDLLPVGTAFHLARNGEDPRFQGTVLRVPNGTLRDRPGDVEAAHEIARRHHAFRWRILVGPGYRADCLACLEVHPEVTAAELARRTYASFATAWGVMRDVRLLGGLSAVVQRLQVPTSVVS